MKDHCQGTGNIIKHVPDDKKSSNLNKSIPNKIITVGYTQILFATLAPVMSYQLINWFGFRDKELEFEYAIQWKRGMCP